MAMRGRSDLQQCPRTMIRAVDHHHLYSEIVILNNRGSLLLNAGKFKGASALFSSALQALKKISIPSSSQQLCNENEDTISLVRLMPKIECFFSNPRHYGQHCRDLYQSPPSSSVIENNHDSPRPSWSSFPSGGDFVHDKPIELYQHTLQEEWCDGEAILTVNHHDQQADTHVTTTTMIAEHRVFQIVSFCVVYNLALSSHLLAMNIMMQAESQEFQRRREGEDQGYQRAEERKRLQTTLQHAAQLYAHAHVLLTRCSVQEDYCILHDLAIFNNHGHVLYKLGRVTEGRRNFQILFQSIILRSKTFRGNYTTILGSRDPSCLSHHGHHDDQVQMLDGLLSNVLYYLMGSCTNAPAA